MRSVCFHWAPNATYLYLKELSRRENKCARDEARTRGVVRLLNAKPQLSYHATSAGADSCAHGGLSFKRARILLAITNDPIHGAALLLAEFGVRAGTHRVFVRACRHVIHGG